VSKHNSQRNTRTRKHAVTKRTSKRRGELAELAFLFKAASLGFTVTKPYGDSDRYDFILDSGSRLFRVQVKSASRISQGTYFITTQRSCNGRAIPYTADEIDFLVGYIFPEDAWVVIPVATLAGRKSIHIFPRNRARYGIYSHYRDAWCQLACPRQHPSSGELTIQLRCGRRREAACPLHLQPRTRHPL
jgi:hypothetical protein